MLEFMYEHICGMLECMNTVGLLESWNSYFQHVEKGPVGRAVEKGVQ